MLDIINLLLNQTYLLVIIVVVLLFTFIIVSYYGKKKDTNNGSSNSLTSSVAAFISSPIKKTTKSKSTIPKPVDDGTVRHGRITEDRLLNKVYEGYTDDRDLDYNHIQNQINNLGDDIIQSHQEFLNADNFSSALKRVETVTDLNTEPNPRIGMRKINYTGYGRSGANIIVDSSYDDQYPVYTKSRVFN